MSPPLVPPLKCQGIKTKLVGEISRLVQTQAFDRWVEPFCGSCVIALNIQPKRALLCDSNIHIIRLYADPPYAGRHVDYFNSWSEADETELAGLLKQLPCGFILSTWHSNEFRTNPLIVENWTENRFHILKREHFYHVGATEDLRHPMIEALITNFPAHSAREAAVEAEQMAFFERPPSTFSGARQNAAH
jgi:site-specific DNA-adenine methylase